MSLSFESILANHPVLGNHDTQGRVMLFDLSINGHHPAYIQHLIEYWQEHHLPGHLDIVVSAQFMKHHADVVSLAAQDSENRVRFVAIAPEAETGLKSRKSGLHRTLRAFQEWHLLCHYAILLKATHCLLLYFDTCQLPLAFWQKPPCSVSGIYFKPTFHYGDFTPTPRSWRDAPLAWFRQRWQVWREKIVLGRVLHNPQLKTLFCLDPFVVSHLERFSGSVQVVELSDPVRLIEVSQDEVKRLRNRLGITSGRRVFLLFGALTGRKGIYELLDAVAMLPQDLGQRFCLVLAGQANPQEQARIAFKIERLSQFCNFQVVHQIGFIPEPEVPVYFNLADVVLAPYQHHVGMSGILLQAAAAGKPVLSSNYGLMGEIVRRYGLGIAIDTSTPMNIAEGLIRYLQESPEKLCDRDRMQLLTAQNSVEKFASTIFASI